MEPTVSAERIARRVRLFCGQKVMLDRDSAALYGVEVAGSGAGRQAQPGPVPT